MLMGELFLAIILAVLFTIIFSFGLKRPGPWWDWWAFSIIIFLVALAAAVWINPSGPVIAGVYWLPVVFFTFIIAILLAAGTPRRSETPKVETISEVKEKEKAADRMVDVFFWLFLITLIVIIVLGYLGR